jgi:mannose-1-phosphate guanylyltransferase
MAGGIGSRFWPMSTEAKPKQFHDVLGTGKSLLQSTVDRLLNLSSINEVLIVTSIDYKALIMEQLPDLPSENILCEPSRKNTAPCIAYAAKFIAERDANAKMIVAPADHIILNEKEFVDTINIALQQADDSTLITLGIQPSRPDTGYGYIQYKKESTDSTKDVRGVIQFAEKPDLEKAKAFIQSGDYLWNSGIFVWSVNSILTHFKNLLPEISTLFEASKNVASDIDTIYQKCQSISVDYGIMEKATLVKVILSDFAWSDLGTWGSLYTHIPHDTEANAVIGDKVFHNDCKESIIKQMNSDKATIIKGLEDYIVVDTPKSLLICPKSEEQEIKTMLKSSGY